MVTRRSIEQVKKDFRHESNHPSFRCSLCNEMQERGSTMFWVSDSSSFFKKESYESLVIGANEGNSFSGACSTCLMSRPSKEAH